MQTNTHHRGLSDLNTCPSERQRQEEEVPLADVTNQSFGRVGRIEMENGFLLPATISDSAAEMGGWLVIEFRMKEVESALNMK